MTGSRTQKQPQNRYERARLPKLAKRVKSLVQCFVSKCSVLTPYKTFSYTHVIVLIHMLMIVFTLTTYPLSTNSADMSRACYRSFAHNDHTVSKWPGENRSSMCKEKLHADSPSYTLCGTTKFANAKFKWLIRLRIWSFAMPCSVRFSPIRRIIKRVNTRRLFM